MIIGVGHDIVNIHRIEKALKRFGNRFVQRIFRPIEYAHAHRPHQHAAHYAKRFAAKEAVLKALGIGFAHGVSWHDIWIEKTPTGQPIVHLSHKIMELLPKAPDGKTLVVRISLSDDAPYAAAMAIASFDTIAPQPR